jgi:hypothetical protein
MTQRVARHKVGEQRGTAALPASLQEKLDLLLKENPHATAARILGIAETTLDRVAGGGAVQPTTMVRIQRRLNELP